MSYKASMPVAGRGEVVLGVENENERVYSFGDNITHARRNGRSVRVLKGVLWMHLQRV